MSARPGTRARLEAGELLVGPASMTGSPAVVETIASSGFDWVMLDVEHGPTGIDSELENLIRAADAAGLPAAVRVPDRDGSGIAKALDFGAEAIWVPRVETAEEAAACASQAKYPGLGNRGSCLGTRAGARGAAWDAYHEVANRDTLLVLLIESGLGLDNIEEIAAVPGVDALCLGPFDYALDIGLDPAEFIGEGMPGPRHPTIEAAGLRILEACRANDLIACNFALTADWIDEWAALGFRNILFGTDVTLLGAALREVDAGLVDVRARYGGVAAGVR
jgi:4-hydroxy-2-oxoheptanedioate aldolase